jgi:homogentisate 1,2-dioxygenase
VAHQGYEKYEHNGKFTNDFSEEPTPAQMRWDPPAIPDADTPTDFVDGLVTFCGAGSIETKAGLACHMYACNKSMEDRAFYNADGDLLIVPQTGGLDITTECGKLYVNPGEICVIPRGIQFSVAVEGPTRGYIAECYTGHFRVPDLGPIGANGLANPRDFKYPIAWYEDRDCDFEVIGKYVGSFWKYKKDHSIFNVVAWHGNYSPFKYNLDDFNTINSVSYDHLDPSIFTVLTCPSGDPGVAAIDFAIFPPRHMVQENTFRPPYYHKNVMSEYMGLVRGVYEVKLEKDGFVPGGGSLHSPLSAHGPDATAFERATNAELLPDKLGDTMAFMFESTYVFRTTKFAETLKQQPYSDMHCWQGLPKMFQKPE